MAVHYQKSLIGRIKAAKLVPVTIAIGGDIQWQGGVTVGEQLELLSFLQRMQSSHPIENLPPAKDRSTKAVGSNGVPTSDAPATGIPAAQPTDGKQKPSGKGNGEHVGTAFGGKHK